MEIGEESPGFSAEVGDSPIGFPLDRAFEILGKPIPKEAGLYVGFRLWLAPHRVAILRKSGQVEPTSVGIEIEYLNEDRTCSVVSLLPTPKFVEHGSVWVQGSISATGEIDAESAPPSPEALPLALGDLEFRASAGAGLAFRFRASVVTQVLSAEGIGSPRCQWKFNKGSAGALRPGYLRLEHRRPAQASENAPLSSPLLRDLVDPLLRHPTRERLEGGRVPVAR